MSGDGTAKSTEQNQSSFAQTLDAAFKTQFGAQSSIYQNLTNRLSNMMANPTGFTPQTMSTLNSNAINQTATDTAQAKTAAQEATAARGGSTLPSGVQAQVQGQIAAAGSNEKSQLLNQNQIANAQQQQQNYWSAAQGLSGVAAGENPNGFASSGNSAASDVAGLSEAYSSSNPLLAGLKAGAGALGSGVGAGLSGGAGSAVSNVGSGNFGW
jgi:hypothetical protein